MDDTTQPPTKQRVSGWWRWFSAQTESKHAPLAVFVWSFLNPLLIPFPAESLLAPIALVNKKRALYLTALASVATALGAAVGYVLSVFLYDAFVAPFVGADVEAQLATLAALAEPWAIFGIVFVAALTLIPDPPFIAAAGLLRLDFITFIVAFFLGRTLRFALVIGIVLLFGKRALLLVERLERRVGFALIVLLALVLGVGATLLYLVIH